MFFDEAVLEKMNKGYHAIKTAEVLNHLSPVRVLASGLSIFPDTPLMEEVRRGEFAGESPWDDHSDESWRKSAASHI